MAGRPRERRAGVWVQDMSEGLAFFFSVATGFVAAGITGSIYRIVTSKHPSFQVWSDTTIGNLLGVATLIFAGPNVILRNAFRAQVFENRPPVWLLFSACLAMIWSFISGIFVLSLILAA